MDTISGFIQDPIVYPIWTLFVVSFAGFVLAVYRSLQGGYFDAAKLPRILDTLVVSKVLPLILLAAGSFFATDQVTKEALLAAYAGGYALALAAEAKALIVAATGQTLDMMRTPLESPR